MARTALLNVMVDAARKAGRSLVRDFNEVENLQVSVKGPGDFVSAADKRAEEIIHRELSKARPGYGFLMEESGTVEGTDTSHTWIIDPLDGTTNFLHSIPIFAVSIGLQRNGVIVAGVIYNPVMDELYVAERGQGAYFNDRRMRVAARTRLHDAVVTTGVPHLGRGDHADYLTKLRAVMNEVAGVRRFGACSIDLAWTASGRVDAFFEENLSPWDTAAGILMVREAGGFVTDITGRDKVFDTGTVLAGNEDIHRQLLGVLKKASA